MDTNKVEKYFDLMAQSFDDYYSGEKAQGFIAYLGHVIFRMPGLRRRYMATMQLIDKSGSKSVLDVGCGNGIYSISLLKKGAKVTGIDVSQAMIDLSIKNALKENIRDYNFIKGDFLAYPFKEKFEAVIAIGVFDYLTPQERSGFIKRMTELSSGLCIATFPKLLTPQYIFRRFWFIKKNVPLFFYTKRKIKELTYSNKLIPEFLNCGPIWVVGFTKINSTLSVAKFH